MALAVGALVFGAGPVRGQALAGLALGASFAGVADGGIGTPPDPQGAAGPEYLLAMTNTGFVAQRKDGSVAASWTPAEFWAPASQGDSLFDPRVMFDGLSGRWFAVMATEGVTAPPAVLLAVSAGADPRQGWQFFRINADPAGESYAEFPLIGANGRWICVTADMISRQSGGLVGGAVWAIEKAPLLEAGSLAVTRFSVSYPGLPLTPVATFDAGEPDEFLVAERSGNDSGQGELEVKRVTGSGGPVQLVEVGRVAAPVPWLENAVPFDSSPQAGTAVKITSPRADVASACLRNGTIWAVHAATVPAGAAPEHTAVQWWRLTTAGALSGFGRIEDPSGGMWLGYPSVAVNAADQVVIGYSIFSTGSYASAGYSWRLSPECDAQLSEIHVLRAGEAPYDRPDAAGLNRWGDLSETAVDPADDFTIWTIQEYAAAAVSGQSRWGTWWGGFLPAPGGRSLACLAPIPASAPLLLAPRRGPAEP